MYLYKIHYKKKQKKKTDKASTAMDEIWDNRDIRNKWIFLQNHWEDGSATKRKLTKVWRKKGSTDNPKQTVIVIDHVRSWSHN